ncbi:AT-hook motif nuclear-localized protein 5 isoform X2 [Abrus precatorius]|uniref:AT-hook motif nuclear-localized protein n=1 Tax=Abrus precatorius TaxID=3816 RepID=A0A8B8LVT2_ABRPR|nr:AT-hook motif nuclear-localized protein 5 isoform X2 [Abrus precatorius]
MDGREAMAFSGGSAPYYMQHRGGVGGSGSGAQSEGFQAPSGFRALSSVRGDSIGSTFSVEPQRGSFGHGINMGSSPDHGVPSSVGPVKKKRGRPRKYGPDGPVSLRLSPMSATANSNPASSTSSQKRPRGRPPGSGRKQQLATLGEWMNSSAGLAFSPHVITVGVGEDIVGKLLSFSQQRPRAVCILSGTGTVSSVTLRQPASTSGRFQILCLSGSYLVAEDGGPRNRTGGMSVSLSSPDGHVIGGGVARLIAASPVQVVVCTFVYGGSKPKAKQGKDSGSEPQSSDKLASPASAPPNQNYNSSSAAGIWPGSRPVDVKSPHPHTGIDLTRG